METERIIMLPEDPGFYEILSIPPPNLHSELARFNGDCAVIARLENGGQLEVVDWNESQEYVWGGELDEVDFQYNPEALEMYA